MLTAARAKVVNSTVELRRHVPKSRGRKKPAKHNGGRAKPQRLQPVPPLIPNSVTDAELSTVQLIAAKVGGLPPEPSCPGPLLVHADGAFECHGDGCPGATVIFHHEDVLGPCSRHPEVRAMHACSRCATHSDGAETLEHICSGQQIEHDDGTFDCTAGERCLGAQGHLPK